MCSPAASFIITQEKVYWSKENDSHIEIRKENNIPENTDKKIDSVQTELLPPNLDFSLPLTQWLYKVDQDLLPAWHVPEYDEIRCREALKEWAKAKLKVRVEQGNNNTGQKNIGNRNSGDCNSGDCNSGDWNSTNNSSNVFCTEEQHILLFDKQSTLTLKKWRESDAYKLLSSMTLTEWINKKDMLPEELVEHPETHCMNGYLRKYEYKAACIKMWSLFNDEEKKIIQSIPNFDAKKFEHVTGIKL